MKDSMLYVIMSIVENNHMTILFSFALTILFTLALATHSLSLAFPFGAAFLVAWLWQRARA
jgi:hypothetical protein